MTDHRSAARAEPPGRDVPAPEPRSLLAAAATGTQAVDRAMSLVSLVVTADEALTFTDLVEETGLARSTTSRLLSALERTGLLERLDDGGSYVAGPLFALYATRHDPWPEVVRLATPTLERIRDRCRETAHFGVARGDEVGFIAQADSEYMLGVQDWTTTEVPSHASAFGKVLYAHGCLSVPRGTLPRYTPGTVASGDELAAQLPRIVDRGFAATVDELEVGLTALSAPVSGRDGDVIAAVGISGPTARLEDRLDEIGALLVEEGRRLSTLLRRRTTQEGQVPLS